MSRLGIGLVIVGFLTASLDLVSHLQRDNEPHEWTVGSLGLLAAVIGAIRIGYSLRSEDSGY